MKLPKKFIFLLLILIFALSIRSEVIGPVTTHNCLRIFDINVWSGLNYKGYIKMGEYETATIREKRYRALLSQIKQLDPDIIGIHEANKLPYYAKRLAKDIEYEVFYHVGVGGIRLGPIGLPLNLREGDAIFIGKHLNPQFVGHKQLSGGYVGNWATFHFSDATQIIAIKITYQNKPIFIFATHWHASLSDASYILVKAKDLYNSSEITEAEYQNILSKIEEGVVWRLSESKKTIDFIRETAKDHPYILMGDFNAESGSQEINNLLKFGMVDVFQFSDPDSSGFTWDPRTNLNYKAHYLKESYSEKDLKIYTRLENFSRKVPKRIDYIFIGPSFLLDSKSISIISSKVVMKEIIHDVHTSDHYGVFAEIQINQ
ncbi:MAG: endonuclease/exonuclease/phosphatase family protein [Candidatus Hodarchaeota archaeon]